MNLVRTISALLLLLAPVAWGADPETSSVSGAPLAGTAVMQGRTVSYANVGGLQIAEGDIVVRPDAPGPKATAPSNGAAAIGVSVLAFLWPNGVVPYTIDPGLPNPQRVLEAIAHWNDKLAGTIRIVPRTSQASYVYFQTYSGGCSSNVGRVEGGASYVYLSDACAAGNVIHEIGHAIGLWHEQSRIDRDAHIRVLTQNIQSGMAYNFNIESYNGRDIGDYDYGSIMHYPAYAFSSNGQPTIETIPPGIPIGQRTALSPLDIEGVRILYSGAGAPPVAAPVITSALSAAGKVGVSFAYSITASGSPTSFGATGLPAGLTVNSATGGITGTPTASGTFNVTIRATNGGGTGTATLVLSIQPGNQAPRAVIAATPLYGTKPVTTTFNGGSSTDSDGSIASYAWTFGDGGTGTGVSASHTYTSAGTYVARLVVTDNQGATGSASVTVSVVDPVAPAPTGTFSASPASVPAGDNAELTWTTLNATKVTIAPGIGEVSAAGQLTVTPSTTTKYTLTVSGLRSTITKTVTVTVTSPPEASPLPTPTLNWPSVLALNAVIQVQYPAEIAVERFDWSFVPVTTTADRAPSATSGAGAVQFATPGIVAVLGREQLRTGLYAVSVQAVDTMGRRSAAATARVQLVEAAFDRVRVYPMPWRADRHPLPLHFGGLGAGARVKIFTVAGHLVRDLGTFNTSADWDLKNDAGDRVASGIYVYLVESADGRRTRGKLAIMR